MSVLRFSDGIEIDTSGPYRLHHEYDGWYVVGHGCLIPVEDPEDGYLMVQKLVEEKK